MWCLKKRQEIPFQFQTDPFSDRCLNHSPSLRGSRKKSVAGFSGTGTHKWCTTKSVRVSKVKPATRFGQNSHHLRTSVCRFLIFISQLLAVSLSDTRWLSATQLSRTRGNTGVTNTLTGQNLTLSIFRTERVPKRHILYAYIMVNQVTFQKRWYHVYLKVKEESKLEKLVCNTKVNVKPGLLKINALMDLW